jgi:hypothetical protein
MPSKYDEARLKIRQVLRFLKDFQQLRTPPKRNIDEYDWRLFLDDLPNHSSVKLGGFQQARPGNPGGVTDGVVLRIRRPLETPCPVPPTILEDWLIPGWDGVESEVRFTESRNRPSDNGTITERFEASADRVRVRNEWLRRRDDWVQAERPVRDAAGIYQRLYQLWGQMQRESERVQLLLGEGMLRIADTAGVIDHPILLQRVELRFDPREPEFSVVETDDPPELAMSLLGSFSDADMNQVAACQSELSRNDNLHPLGHEETSGFLGRLVQGVFASGKLLDDDDPVPDKPEKATLRRNPVIFLAPRAGAFTSAIDKALESLNTLADECLPRVIAAIVGVDLSDSESEPVDDTVQPVRQSGPSQDLLLTRPANPEQEQVIRQLQHAGMVLVQGPPGTGKTHTIANLVGHLLAQGKSVLITSHTTKALRVVREKIAENIRPLCVSYLDTSMQSRQELEEAVNAISQRIGATTPQRLDANVERWHAERENLRTRLGDAELKLQQAIRDEYDDIVVGGKGVSPAEAARKVREWTGMHDWIPGRVERGAVLPVSMAELAELYRSNELLTSAEETDLAHELPEFSRLPTADQFSEIVENVGKLRIKCGSHAGDLPSNSRATPKA